MVQSDGWVDVGVSDSGRELAIGIIALLTGSRACPFPSLFLQARGVEAAVESQASVIGEVGKFTGDGGGVGGCSKHVSV